MADQTEGVTFTIDSAKRIDRAVNLVEKQMLPVAAAAPRSRRATNQPLRYVGKNITPIIPGGFLCPTGYLWDVYVPDPDSEEEYPPFIRTTDTNLQGLVGVNRHDIEELPGCNLRMEYISGEWGAYDIRQDGSCDSHSSSSSSSSSSASQSESGSSSVSGSGSSSGSCGAVTVVTGVSCSSGGLNVTYGSAKANC